MWNLFLLFIVLALVHSSLGNSITSTTSLGKFDPKTCECSSRNKAGADDLSTELISVDSSEPMLERTTNTNPASTSRNNIGSSNEGVETINMQRDSSLPSLSPISREGVGVNTIPEDFGSSGEQNSEESRVITDQISMVPNDQDDNRHETANIDTLQQQRRLPLINNKSMKEDPDAVPAGPSDFIIDQDRLSYDGPCVPMLASCAALAVSNGTHLLWDDMRRTLAFAWELHVFGSASLFALLAGLAVMGMIGASTLVHPLCGPLTLANSLLLLTGTQRAVLLLLDPYGTRQILARPTLAAFHNLPLNFLLWAQVVLALVALRGVILRQLPQKLQRPWLVGVLAVLHCALLLAADLLSPVLSLTFPLLLHTFSLCCALPSCVEILSQSFSRLQLSISSPKPEWGMSQRIENHARRLMVVCSVLGVLCCCLQVYTLLWLYGVLGSWRRFSWCWWLSQFWARVVELAWGFVLLALGSWILWTPQKSRLRGDHWQGRQEWSSGSENTSFWDRVFIKIGNGQFRQSENTWVDLMPNTWSSYPSHRSGFNNSPVCTLDEPVSTIIPNHMPCPVISSSCNSQAVTERDVEPDSFLSLVEFEMRPPSPIDLVGSIDYALSQGDFSRSLFKSRPHITGMVDPDVTHGQGTAITPSPVHVAFRETVETGFTSGSPENVPHMDIRPSPNAYTDYTPNRFSESDETPERGQQNSEIESEWMHQDWTEDDIIDL
ncbi:uncharacterized protein LOC132471156 isoform X1 [Gadus macrocephalus]|uniref:uncharacterized protein LOC132471156 isoform X1 n=2 Tax=Gadus macrocephalus TaxID=80720 RepID=UPI0028CB679F|nr:uncharacterized protein LOC132471156 isoform X1 [Gadus macrocephalus]